MTKPFLYMTKPCPHITTSLLHITKCPKTVMAWDTCISILDTQPPEERLPTAKGAKSPSLATGKDSMIRGSRREEAQTEKPGIDQSGLKSAATSIRVTWWLKQLKYIQKGVDNLAPFRSSLWHSR